MDYSVALENDVSTSMVSGISSVLMTVSKLFFAATILLSPFRFRFVLYQLRIPPVYADYTDGLLFLSDIALFLAVVSWLIALILSRMAPNFGISVITFPLLGLIFISIIGIPHSYNTVISFYQSIRLIILFGFYLYLVNCAPEQRPILWAVAAMILIQGMIGYVQVMKQTSLEMQFLGEYELNPDWSGVSILWANGKRLLRAYGLSDHPNILGGLFSFALIWLSAWWMEHKTRFEEILVGIFQIGLIGMFVTFSRSAWLAYLVGSAFLIGASWLQRNREALYRLLGLAIAGFMVVAPLAIYYLPFLNVRFGQNKAFQEIDVEQRSFEERAVLNRVANELFIKNALLGVGLGAFPVALKENYPNFPYYYQPPHFTILNAASETGIMGALCYMTLLVSPWILLWINRRQLNLSSELIAASAVNLTVSVVGFFDYYTWLLPPGRLWQFFVWGWWVAAYLQAKGRKRG